MSSTEIVHGNNNVPPTGYSQAGQNDDPMRYAAHAQQPHAAVAVGSINPAASAPATHGVEDKRFMTSYGTVVWPSLPGLSSSPSRTPAAVGRALTKPESAGLVHHHHPSGAAAAAAARRTAEQQRNGMGGGGSLVS